MTYTKKDVYNWITSNPTIAQHEDTERYYFTDAVLFAKPDTLENEVYELLSEVCRDIDSGSHDLDYDILANALQYIDDEAMKFEDFTGSNFEMNYPFDGFASMWNNERLAYLNIHNEYDIMQVGNEMEVESINNACAFWFDRKVEECIYSIIDALK